MSPRPPPGACRPSAGWCRAARCSTGCRASARARSSSCARRPAAARPRCCAHGWSPRGWPIGSPGCRSSAASGMRSASGSRWSTRSPARPARTGWWSGSAPTPAFGGEAVVERLLSDLRARWSGPSCWSSTTCTSCARPRRSGCSSASWPRLPPALRVVLATREDVGLGLHRLRLAGALTEIRGADLRFSLDETRELLEASGIALSDAGSARSGSGPRGGPPACGSRRSRSPGTPIPSGSSPSSPAASAPSPATCWRRCWSASRRTCATCCCAPPCSSGSTARSPTP